MEPITIGLALVGVALGVFGKTALDKNKGRGADAEAKKIIAEAKAKAKETTISAKEQAVKALEEAKLEEKRLRDRLAETESRVARRETSLDEKFSELERKSEHLKESEKEIDAIKDELRAIRTKQEDNLEKIAKLKKADATKKIMEMTEKEIKHDLLEYIEKRKREAKETADHVASEIMVEAMERMATEVATERVVTTVPLPSDDVKGRIIGKEGRNIQALERATGVDILVDETPGVVVVSGFDPVRRQVARVAIERLIKDGRIHPARIEEVVKKAQNEIEDEIKKAGEEAGREAGVVGLPPEIVRLMGSMKFRTSYSQNVLKHSVEMAHLGAMIAEEVGADVRVTRRAAYLHDLGKAVTHEMEGKHHHLTRVLLEKYGLDEPTIHAAEAHHDDIEATTPEAVIVRAVDALSAGRPGARGDSVENFAKRMTDLENIANTFPGMQKVYAMSAGREIRVFVKPEEIDDLSAIRLARDIANKIEATLKYPGTIKVNVIRETRAEEYAK
ncbi:ribonuclease Y [Candidatus Saccharibacteria bacterium]|nr:ribonuclease Y [Candidatus Saccharibacteria bacterium]